MKFIFLSFTFLFFNLTTAQEKEIKFIKKGDFPEGIYMNLEDVLNKKPFSTQEVYFKTTYAYDSVNLPEKAFFYYKFNNERVIYPLAISYKGEMYFQTYNKSLMSDKK